MIGKEELEQFSMELLVPYSNGDPYFNLFPGEHYRLLAYLSSILPVSTTIADVGTYKGLSALALSSNPKVKVISFDIDQNYIMPNLRGLPNVTYFLGSWESYMDQVLQCGLILFDTLHDGGQEARFHQSLVSNGYIGTVIYDDIHMNDNMQYFWDRVQEEKIDLTEIGHATGTGMVIFNGGRGDYHI